MGGHFTAVLKYGSQTGQRLSSWSFDIFNLFKTWQTSFFLVGEQLIVFLPSSLEFVNNNFGR